MTLDNINKWLGLCANVGVIAGIVFLAYELRQNNEQMALQTREDALGRRNGAVDTLIANPDLLSLLAKPEQELSTLERDRLVALGIKVLLGFEEEHRLLQRGLADAERMKRGQRAVFHRERLNYAIPLTWEVYKKRASPEFVQWFEKNIVPP